MSPEFAYLPPLPPIGVPLAARTPAAVFPSGRRESVVASITVLLAGISVLAWTTQLDTTGSQIYVTAAAVLTVILPEATFALLRATSRQH